MIAVDAEPTEVRSAMARKRGVSLGKPTMIDFGGPAILTIVGCRALSPPESKKFDAIPFGTCLRMWSHRPARDAGGVFESPLSARKTLPGIVHADEMKRIRSVALFLCIGGR
jgi:hypothetical protein